MLAVVVALAFAIGGIDAFDKAIQEQNSWYQAQQK